MLHELLSEAAEQRFRDGADSGDSGDEEAAIAHARAAYAFDPPATPSAARYADVAAHHDHSAATHAARLRAPAVRLGAEYGIDLATVWPRLWLLLPAATRDTLTETRTRLDTAFALGGWALLYLLLALHWWPAALIALVTALVARRRAALAAEAYAEPRPSPQQGRALTERLRRGL